MSTHKSARALRLRWGWLSVAGACLVLTPAAGCAEKPVEKSVPLDVGRVWTYRVSIPQGAELIYDPYFVSPDGLIGTSATHGYSNPQGEAVESRVSLRVVEALSEQVVGVVVTTDVKALWFALGIKEYRLALQPRSDKLWALELHGVADLGGEGDPWVLGQTLALLPVGAPVNEAGIVAEPLAEPVQVPAGTFTRGYHSVRTGGGEYGSSVPAYKVESWVVDGVGLVKYVLANSEGEPQCTLELVSSGRQ